MKIPVTEFKKKTNIPMEQSIMINLLRHIDENISDPPPLELLNESLPLFMHFEKCFLYYIMCKLGTNDTKSIIRKTRKYKSFNLMTRMLKIFKEEIGVDEKYLQKHLYILDFCPDETENALETLKNIKIGTMTIYEAIKKQPNILQYDSKNIKELLQSIKKFEVDDKAVDYYLKGLNLTNDTFVKKMTYYMSQPDIKVWCKSSRILYFMTHEDVIMSRINYLRKIGFIKWANMHLLTCSNQYFKKYLDDELRYTNKRTYVKYILYKELGYDKLHVVNSLMRHPYWNRISFTDMNDTLCSLKNNFSIEDICKNIHLVLYPWPLIDKALEKIQDPFKQKQKYTSCQLLALCLYLLEKNNHFTGDGVWNLDMKQSQSLKKKKTALTG